jgi:N-methylhydantoinase A
MSRLAFDTGGTFTDFALVDDAGVLHLHKVLSTPSNPAEAVIQGIGELLTRETVSVKKAGVQILGATTVVTNAVLERKGIEAAFITTRGFQDLLRIRTEGRYDLYDLAIEYPAPLVPRDRCYGVAERMAADGRTIVELNEDSVGAIAAELRKSGIRSVGVCLLHSYKFPVHERRVRDLLRKADSGLSVSLSSEVCPEVREYDRASTTVVNAYTQPLMDQHVAMLESHLREADIHRQMLWMTSSGGVVPSSLAARMPVKLIESGPAAGAVAAAEYARLAGENSVMSFDMGGTTAKLCLVPNGQPMVGSELEIARHERFRRGSGFPLKIQSIQMIEIGAGGGSTASRSQLGLLEVGPHSAGAVPGPACYGRGGTKPTVTDADVLLGYIGAESFLGGDFKLDKKRAEVAIAELANSLGVTPERCAFGIHDLVNGTMAEAATMHAADYGVDPGSLPLVAFGGAGPVHAYGVARKLNAKRVICPAGAGVTSAVGLLIAPVAVDTSASLPMRASRWNYDQIKQTFAQLEKEGREVVVQAGVDPDEITLTYSVDARYVGQGHEINVALPSVETDLEEFQNRFLDAFTANYESLFGRRVEGSIVEAITWRLRVSGPKGVSAAGAPRRAGARSALKNRRLVYFDELQAFVETPVYDYYLLPYGDKISGPAIVEQVESTIVVGPHGVAHVDERNNLIIDIEEK